MLFISPKTDVLAFSLVEFTEAETRLSQQQSSARVGFGFFFVFVFVLIYWGEKKNYEDAVN